MKTCHMALAATFTAAAVVAGAVRADHSDKKVDAPGFRPDSAQAARFVEEISTARVAVFPAITRTKDGASYDANIPGQVIAFLEEHELGAGRAEEIEFDTTGVEVGAQYAMFQGGMKAIGEQLDQYEGEADYVLVTEYLVPRKGPEGTAVFGIHCYILDREGKNAFSFLLNSHHKPFVDAELSREDASSESMTGLVEESTRVALESLREQVAQTRAATSD